MEPTRKKTKPFGQSLPLTAEMVSTITTMLKAGRDKNDLRDLALFRTGICTMLRVSDLLRLTVGDVSNGSGAILPEFTIRQKKTQDTVTVALSGVTQEALRSYIATLKDASNDRRLFTISVRQVQRIIKGWMRMIRVDSERYTPHSLRRTKASIIYSQHKDIEVVRQLLGHASTSVTSRYLGVERRKALDVARSVEI